MGSCGNPFLVRGIGQVLGIGMTVLPDETREGLLERLARLFVWIAGGLILACAVLVTLDVFARQFFNDNFFESFEITIYTYAVTVAFSFAFALTSKTHIRIDVIYGRLPDLYRALLDIAAVGMLSALAIVLSYYAWSTTLQSFSFPGPGRLGAVSASDLSVPLVIPQALWSLGLSWFALICVVYLVRALINLSRRNYRAVEKLIGVEQYEAELEDALAAAHTDSHAPGQDKLA